MIKLILIVTLKKRLMMKLVLIETLVWWKMNLSDWVVRTLYLQM